jgi:hypothetical protein
MLALIKRFWQYLALLAGIGLIVFEIVKPGGVSGESWFWLVVGVLIILLAGMEIVQRWGRRGRPGSTDRSDATAPHRPDRGEP